MITLSPILTAAERRVFTHLLSHPGQIITYAEFRSIGVRFTSGKYNLSVLISGIRCKYPSVQIFCVHGKGYRYEGNDWVDEPEPEPMHYELIGRPESGPRCKCGKVLYGYEHGRCLSCRRRDLYAWRQG